MRKTVLIADDHPVYLLGLRTLLQSQAGRYEVIHEAVSADELVEKLTKQPVDVVITDLSMPGQQHADGLALVQYVRRRWPDIVVIVVTMITNPGIQNSLSRLGVQAILNKNSLSVDLLQTMKSLFSPTARKATVVKNEVAVALSPKEMEVLRLLLRGLTVNEISAHLKRTKQTVSAQKSSAMRKLGVTSEFELYQYAQQLGLNS
ncbi:DNA-binding response regulator [Izhakiella australiensis]|uniref:DNA-binding response regulator n=1 Tax=Izhakiella australiensis TaxID=1926881 RepID=A0A1S8YR83_9GAMM|nr:response regulator transcription factor [Izhakiella australiensis]OON41332.1 DNA-binding response regulator [Izhakiella australiensis]